MPTLVSRNTIKLADSASSVDDYYLGYTLVLKRFDTTTGKLTTQRKEIVGYVGSSRIATLDGIWEESFIPKPGDTYDILPTYPDSRVSINLAIQTLDYITSDRYSKGLSPFNDLNLPSWLETARRCDSQSDVTVQLEPGYPVPSVGAVYRHPQTGPIAFQGEVKKITEQVDVKGVMLTFVTFTKVLGKYTNKWNSWKTYNTGDYVYDGTNFYFATTTGIKSNKPTHTSGDSGGLQFEPNPVMHKVSGPGESILSFAKNSGNPVRSANTKGVIISGYSLYDADGIDYWRYVGWDEHSQRYVTRHQGNLIVDTSIPIFDNINSLLEHFGGLLRYSGGKYSLDLEEGEGEIENEDTEPRNLSADDIIGKIRINDEGVRSAFNSLTVAYADPANKFEAKNISFFNSEFLKSDRNVPKKGNLSLPGVTNYYNARMLADKFLVKSRYGLTISMNLAPKGLLLFAGMVVQIQHPRYGWVNKKFRIENITHNTDATVDIVAKEYDDKFYIISNLSRPPAAALAAESNTSTNIRPQSLTATNISNEDETVGAIEVSWVNSPGADATVSTQLFSSKFSNLYTRAYTISPTGLFDTQTPHGLVVGDTLTSNTGKYGLEKGKTYYITSAPIATKFTLSDTPNGPTQTFVAAPYVYDLTFTTGHIIATLDASVTSFIDIINTPSLDPEEVAEEEPIEGAPEEPPLTPEEEEDLERIRRYYWIRHKITVT